MVSLHTHSTLDRTHSDSVASLRLITDLSACIDSKVATSDQMFEPERLGPTSEPSTKPTHISHITHVTYVTYKPHTDKSHTIYMLHIPHTHTHTRTPTHTHTPTHTYTHTHSYTCHMLKLTSFGIALLSIVIWGDSCPLEARIVHHCERCVS